MSDTKRCYADCDGVARMRKVTSVWLEGCYAACRSRFRMTLWEKIKLVLGL